MNKHGLSDEAMKENDLTKKLNIKICPRDSKITTDKGFVNIDNGEQGGTYWTCFNVKDNKSSYFDSFYGSPDKLLLHQSPKTITYHNFEIQDIKSRLCGTYCIYCFYLMERRDFYDAVLNFILVKSMPISVFGRTSGNMERKLDTSSFVQKSYLRTKYIEGNIEKDIERKNRFKIKTIPIPVDSKDCISKFYVDEKYSSLDNETLVKSNKNNNFIGITLLDLDSVYVNKIPNMMYN